MDNDTCIVLKRADPKVCHILPHSASESKELRSKGESYIDNADSLLFSDNQTELEGSGEEPICPKARLLKQEMEHGLPQPDTCTSGGEISGSR
jgi:hypothetical protein